MNATKHVYYHLDAHGHVQFLLDGNGDVLDKYTYDAFGKPKIMDVNGAERTTTSNGNRFLFTGREYLSALGLYDYRHRVYHPALGRFMQIDPMGLQIEGAKLSAQQTALYVGGGAPAAFSSSELNLYRYCHNNPINKSDPLGLEPLAKGLLDVPSEVLKNAYENAKKAAEISSANTDRRTQTETRIDGFRDKNGKIQSTDPAKGYKHPSPHAPPPALPKGVTEAQRLSQGHSHVGSSTKHYGGDKASANDVANPTSPGALPLVSAVSSTIDKGIKQEFYIPSANQAERARNAGGGFFTTKNGTAFTPVPHH